MAPEPKRTTRSAETASYIAEMLTELLTIARRAGFRDLPYLIDMARIEALTLARVTAARAAGPS